MKKNKAGSIRLALICIAVFCTPVYGAASSHRLTYPPSPRGSVKDTYFGYTVADPYRWLEDGNSPVVKAWAAAQTKLALSFIHGQPSYAQYKQRVAELSKTSTQRFGLAIRGDHFFYLRETPPQAQPQLVVRDGLHGQERVLFDPQSTAGSAPAPSIETYLPAPDGSMVAFTTQMAGAENETLHFVDAATGAMLPDELPHVGGGTSPTALAWDGDAKGITHTIFPKNADGTYSTAHIYLVHHTLGADASTDTYVFGNGLSARAEYQLTASTDGKELAAFVADGDGVHTTVYLRSGGGAFERVATPEDAIGDSANLGGRFVGDILYVISKKRDSRGEIVAIAPNQTFDNGKVAVPASSVVIDNIEPVAGGFVTLDIDGGDGSARLFTTDGSHHALIPIPPVSTLSEVAGDPTGGPIIIGYETYTKPDSWNEYDPKTNALTPTGIFETSPADLLNVVVERVFVPSLDGKVHIPFEILSLRRTKKDGTAPTIMTAYGAYGSISSPSFGARRLAWLERGGIWAQAMIRGGGEYGEDWHLAAHLATKTVSSDDLAACAKWLASHKYANQQHIGIIGGSAGGFLMGLAMTRNPELYRAVVSAVGIYDLLRVELTPNGAYNTPEFGTVKDPEQFKWMVRQSPYHNVIKGQAYPAVLMTTGENDPRVAPYMSRKMIAKLQVMSTSPYPELLIQRSGQGHGIGNSFDQNVEATVDEYTFFDSQLR